MEPLELMTILHTQEVRGSSPCAPTIFFKSLRLLPTLRGVDSDTEHLLFPVNGGHCANTHAARLPLNFDWMRIGNWISSE
jgi:hypothetical protein